MEDHSLEEAISGRGAVSQPPWLQGVTVCFQVNSNVVGVNYSPGASRPQPDGVRETPMVFVIVFLVLKWPISFGVNFPK